MLFAMQIRMNSSIGQSMFTNLVGCSNKPISSNVMVVKATGAGLPAVNGNLLNLNFYQVRNFHTRKGLVLHHASKSIISFGLEFNKWKIILILSVIRLQT
jgi:hypothetical protein